MVFVLGAEENHDKPHESQWVSKVSKQTQVICNSRS